ncbi:translocation/assembly module TamB domain-containing protein [bacterium]|nr:translocation/assembly module TamB domain-containing protein [bacterium]
MKFFLRSNDISCSVSYENLKWGLDKSCEIENLYFKSEGAEQCIELHIDTLKIAVNSLGLGRSNWNLKYVLLHNPEIHLSSQRDSTQKKEKTESATNQFPVLKIDIIEVRHGNLFLGKQDIFDLNCVTSLSSSKQLINADIAELSTELPGRGKIKNAQGNVHYGSTLHTNLELTLLKTECSLDMEIQEFSPLTLDVLIIGDEVNLNEVDSLIGLHIFKGDGKVLIHTWGIKDAGFNGEVEFTGTLFGEDYRDAETKFRSKDNVVYLTDFNGYLRNTKLIGDLTLDFSKEIKEFHGDFYVANMDLRNILQDPSASESDFSGRCWFDGKNLDPEKFSFILNAYLSDGSFTFLPFDTAVGKLYVNKDTVYFYPNTNFSQGETDISLEGFVFSKVEKLELDLHVETSDLYKFLESIDKEVDNLTGTGTLIGQIHGSQDNPAFTGNFTSDSVRVSSVLLSEINSNVQLDYTLPDPGGTIKLSSKGKIGNLELDSVYSIIELTPERLRLKPLLAWGDSLYIKSIGTLQPIDQLERTFILEGLRIFYLDELIEIADECTFLVNDTLISTENINLSCLGGTVSTSIKQGPDNITKLEGELNKIDFGRLNRVFKTKYSTSGIVNSNFSIRIPEDTEDILGRIFLDSDSLDIEGIDWQNIWADLILEEGYLYIDSLLLQKYGGTYSVHGMFGWADTLHPLYLDINGEDEELSFINVLVPQITKSKGHFILDIDAIGDLDTLVTSGTITIKDAELELKDFAYPIRGLNTKMSIEKSQINIDEFSGYIEGEPIHAKSLWEKIKKFFTGKEKIKGEFEASGGMDISSIQDPKANIRIECERLPIWMPGEGLYGKFSSDLVMIYNDNNLAIEGSVEVNEVNLVKLPEMAEDDTEQSQLPDFNVVINIPNNFWVLTEDQTIEAELQGELLVTTLDNNLNLLGDLEIIRGKYRYSFSDYPAAIFEIQSGAVYFNNLEEIDPELDIHARTLTYDQYVYLDVTGTLTQPELHLYTENPQHTEKDAIALLTLNRPVNTTGDSVSQTAFLQDRTQKLLEAYVQTQVQKAGREFLGVETFEIKPDEENQFQLDKTEITLGKYLTDNIYVSYSRELSAEETGKLQLEYRLGRHSTVRASRDETGYYKIDLQFKWEF